MTSTVDIVNRSLLQIGARAQVSRIVPSDGSTEGDAASVLFTPTYENLARSAHWNCFRKEAALSMIAAAAGTAENPTGTTLPIPSQPWQYAYSLPSDCLFMRAVMPSLQPTGNGVSATSYNNSSPLIIPGLEAARFLVSYSQDANGNPIQTVLTNVEQAIAVYTVNQPNPAGWDSMFQAAMVSALAAHLCPALSLNLALLQGLIAASEKIVMQARAADGNEGSVSQDHVPDWFRARGGENRATVGSWSGSFYENMNYPG